MKKEEVLRFIDSIHRDKNISKEVLFQGLEYAMCQAAVRVYNAEPEEVEAQISRLDGKISVRVKGELVDIDSGEMGRIAAQTTKQVLNTKIREAVRDIVVEEFSSKLRTLVTAEVQRRERGNIVVTVHGVEAIIPKEHQVPIERYRTGDRLRCYVLEINTRGTKANLILSRSHPELVHELFMTDVPEIADGIIVVQELAREPGFRTKIAVHCDDDRIDCVGACVGPRGTRIRNIINELGGEKIDIIRWDPAPEAFISNALAPARISRVYLDRDSRDALVIVPDDQLSLAIGKKGQNVRLTCKMTRWNVDVKSESQFEEEKTGGAPKGEAIELNPVDGEAPLTAGEGLSILDNDTTPPIIASEDQEATPPITDNPAPLAESEEADTQAEENNSQEALNTEPEQQNSEDSEENK